MNFDQFIYDQVRAAVRQELMAAFSKVLDELETNLESETAVAALEPKLVRRRIRRRKNQMAPADNGAAKPKRKRATKAEMTERRRLAAADSEETSPF